MIVAFVQGVRGSGDWRLHSGRAELFAPRSDALHRGTSQSTVVALTIHTIAFVHACLVLAGVPESTTAT